jgi:hypothetical protein
VSEYIGPTPFEVASKQCWMGGPDLGIELSSSSTRRAFT